MGARRRILEREVRSIGGRQEWIEPALRYCIHEESSFDARRAVRVCLVGRDALLDGSYQRALRATRNPSPAPAATPPPQGSIERRTPITREQLMDALAASRGRVAAAGRALGVSRQHVHKKMKEWCVDLEELRARSQRDEDPSSEEPPV